MFYFKEKFDEVEVYKFISCISLAASAAVFCTQPHVMYLNMARYKVKLILVFQLIYAFLNVSKLTSRYTVFVIYDDKSHYPSTVTKKTHMWGEYISAKLGEKI